MTRLTWLLLVLMVAVGTLLRPVLLAAHNLERMPAINGAEGILTAVRESPKLSRERLRRAAHGSAV